MRKLALLILVILTTPVFAGFQGINGTTSLGVFNKLTCSTGVTCTKSKDSFTVVSSPTISTGSLTVTAASSASANVDIIGNNGGTNGDKWRLLSTYSTQLFALQNNTSGSFVSKFTIDPSGNTTIAGTLTPSGATSLSGGINSSASAKTRFTAWVPGVATNATSATPSATVVYMTQIWIPHNVTLTGIGVLNAATVGTNKWIVALFDDGGNVLANSNTSGVTTSGASAFQQVAFTGTYAAKGPRTYWIGVYMNGTTDRYYAIPTIGQANGLAGSVSGQTFGTVAAVTLPTTFTADVAPVAYVY